MKKFKIGINNIVYDEWCCPWCDHQYEVIVEAKNEKEAIEKAIAKVGKEYRSLLVSDSLEHAWIKEII